MFGSAVHEVRVAADRLVGADVARLETAELEAAVLAVQQQIARLHGHLAAGAAVLAARDGDDEDTAGWLSRRTRMGRWSARQHVVVGARLARLPRTRAALLGGRMHSADAPVRGGRRPGTGAPFAKEQIAATTR